jgi:hypothetical protein
VHFEILVEDQSGKKALDILVPKIIGNNHTFKVIAYKGIGRIPTGMNSKTDVSKRIILDNLPRLLNGYGKTWQNYPADYRTAVFLVCDLDDKCIKTFRQELYNILNACNFKPEARFCLAIEEGEAWFLGDIPAIKKAYPEAKEVILKAYVNDSICGTWEHLANAVYKGGSNALATKGWQAIGTEKCQWAEKISPHMDVKNNTSPSFCYFQGRLLELAGTKV